VINQERFLKIHSKIKKVANNPFLFSKKVKSFKDEIRRIRFGNYRLFILINKDYRTIYCLAFRHRKNGYGKKTIKELAKIIHQLN
jgi:mRNA-degrading endonuclease RelE of RelBE toxin-antitoxin system